MRETFFTHEEARELVARQLTAWRDEQRRAADSRRALTPRERQTLGLGTEDVVLDFSIVEDLTIECEFGWVFFWQTADPKSSGDGQVLMAGGGPFTVTRTGKLTELGPVPRIDQQIESFKKSGDPLADTEAG